MSVFGEEDRSTLRILGVGVAGFGALTVVLIVFAWAVAG
jgi:hypothetical protein